MTTSPERRSTPDRRLKPRGGRRPTDIPGFTPLVLVVGEDPHARELCEAILAKLQFAVTSASSMDKAMHIIATLRPEIVVTTPGEAPALEAQLENSPHAGIPIVPIAETGPDGSILVESIRAAIRARQ
jgi:CheY-like chemotaxis protein